MQSHPAVAAVTAGEAPPQAAARLQAERACAKAEASGPRAAILFSGSANLAAREAADALAEHYEVGAELWSATSYKRLRENGLAVDRWNQLHPAESPRVAQVTHLLGGVDGPKVAVSDYMKIVPDQISQWVPGTYVTLGTDGFGRSDSRQALRSFFEIDAGNIVVAVLSALVRDGKAKPAIVKDALDRYGIDPDRPDPAHDHR